jgi:hypothetical protein
MAPAIPAFGVEVPTLAYLPAWLERGLGPPTNLSAPSRTLGQTEPDFGSIAVSLLAVITTLASSGRTQHNSGSCPGGRSAYRTMPRCSRAFAAVLLATLCQPADGCSGLCMPGLYYAPPLCPACVGNTYSGSSCSGWCHCEASCTACPSNTVMTSSTRSHPSQCLPAPGDTGSYTGLCPSGQYKADVGTHLYGACPPNTVISYTDSAPIG